MAEPSQTRAAKAPHGTLTPLLALLENSWIKQLTAEKAENVERSRTLSSLPDTDDNRNKRRVFNGHYVLVPPTGLPDPKLIIHSPNIAHELLQLTKEQIESHEFLQWVSGNRTLAESWATPYALSIMGDRLTNNCPFGTGDGYGDGRAISIGEFRGQELQLKGAGKTPFHRGADGRAVLRSSVREFLASEAMHWFGISTTRALSLVVSGSEKAVRPWYAPQSKLDVPTMNDPRLAQYPPSQRRAILRSLRNQKVDPNILMQEPCAITCRVAPSFVRIGHLDLFFRRATSPKNRNNPQHNDRESTDDGDEEENHDDPLRLASQLYNTSTPVWKEYEDMIWHACYREFRKQAYDPFYDKDDLAGAASMLLEHSATNIAALVAGWIRVGFAQGNFNADNCLVGGRTMDYGPFGFMEEYSPVFAKWTGSGPHYGVLNQPMSGLANYHILVTSLVPAICSRSTREPADVVHSFMSKAQEKFESAVDEMFREKLGFTKEDEAADALWEELEPLMRNSRVDWTLVWRQLTYLAKKFPDLESDDYESMLSSLEGGTEACRNPSASCDREPIGPFYESLSENLRTQWLAWLKKWRDCLRSSANDGEDGKATTGVAYFERMRSINPKYVLREWMLVEAYVAAGKGDYTPMADLHELMLHPYEEGSKEQAEKYYRRASDDVLTTAGTAFMS